MSLFEATRRRRLRVLFVCFANACRSRMAEGFANEYAPNLLVAESAGLQPASRVSRRTVAVMAERGIALDSHVPRPVDGLDLDSFDLIVNMSGRALPPCRARVLPVPLPDPGRGDANLHRQVRDSVDRIVRTLVIKLQTAREMAA